MKHSRTGEAGTVSPNVRIEERPIRFVVWSVVLWSVVVWSGVLWSAVVLSIRGATPRVPAGDLPGERLGPGRSGDQGPQGWGGAAQGVLVPHQGGAQVRACAPRRWSGRGGRRWRRRGRRPGPPPGAGSPAA